jgi:hypothetical protein
MTERSPMRSLRYLAYHTSPILYSPLSMGTPVDRGVRVCVQTSVACHIHSWLMRRSTFMMRRQMLELIIFLKSIIAIISRRLHLKHYRNRRRRHLNAPEDLVLNIPFSTFSYQASYLVQELEEPTASRGAAITSLPTIGYGSSGVLMYGALILDTIRSFCGRSSVTRAPSISSGARLSFPRLCRSWSSRSASLRVDVDFPSSYSKLDVDFSSWSSKLDVDFSFLVFGGEGWRVYSLSQYCTISVDSVPR